MYLVEGSQLWYKPHTPRKRWCMWYPWGYSAPPPNTLGIAHTYHQSFRLLYIWQTLRKPRCMWYPSRLFGFVSSEHLRYIAYTTKLPWDLSRIVDPKLWRNCDLPRETAQPSCCRPANGGRQSTVRGTSCIHVDPCIRVYGSCGVCDTHEGDSASTRNTSGISHTPQPRISSTTMIWASAKGNSR